MNDRLVPRDSRIQVYQFFAIFNGQNWVLVVAQLVERSLPTPVIRKLSNRTFVCLLSTVLKRGKKKKWPGIAHFFKKNS